MGGPHRDRSAGRQHDVDIVKRGTEAILEYRESHSGWDRPFDLRNADLSGLALKGADLGGANLSGANLARAVLADCNLSQANLSEATLVGAKFTRCRLREATLCEANASFSKLHSCDFRWVDADGATIENASLIGSYLTRGKWTNVNARSADLLRADLSFSQWRGSCLEGAAMSSTVMAAVDLGGVVGLDLVLFDGPCPIDEMTIRTLESPDRAFLGGCGLPDQLIAFYQDHRRASRYCTAFISYSSSDQDFADRIHADLRKVGLRAWLATEDLKTGDWFRQSIYDAIHVHERLLLVLSRSSIESEWVEDEVNAALERERAEDRLILAPISLDDSLWKTDRAWVKALTHKRHVRDFTNWTDDDIYRSALSLLLRDLRI
jgi:uncharacterized protein YjbI with pentapeptide repeats